MQLSETEINFDNALGVLEKGCIAIQEGDAKIDFSNVKKVDSSAVAAIMEWIRTSQKLGLKLELLNTPTSLDKLMALYHIQVFLSASK